MAKKVKHNWKPPTWLNDPVPSTSWFHDIEVDVYEGTTEVKDISLWKENYRTMLDLEHIQQILKKDLHRITDDEIIEHILRHDLHKIPDLAKSIKENSVRIPLILSYDKELIDGNRRLLACRYLIKKERELTTKFTLSNVKCLSPTASEDVKLKIIAEMNFLPQHKEDWPPYVRAKFAIQEYDNALNKFKNEKEAYKHVNYFLDIQPAKLKRYREVLKMIEEYVKFVEKAGKKTRQDAEIFGRSKFHFFEELYNKADVIDKPVKKMFFRYLSDQQITSMTKVREFAAILRYAPARKHLEKQNGSFELAKSMYGESASPKKALAKIKRFYAWIENLSNVEKGCIPVDLKKRLSKAVQKLLKE
ncbi:MAG: ParB N-terminal domain-containing protein [Planctomycetes bacterium]|nr:ParB N-terminal domain-containing protein [Planctomycetota bacterium]MBL7145757.1 ParB N-terminal domain-containing protein [Phycisphaerae bacterium]